mmetsp:Transcript_39607/g.66408  ORF Transcript_39607/g.66408 Transcript_39607/m.66408 type:complete len:547 (+) Transcript_39607:57-1697(+)
MLKIGGVPEHFNYPFTLAEERGLYKKHGVSVEFVIQKCGTGAMIAALKNKEQDVVVALTEGLVADIAKGSNLKLLGTYVETPLCWAISTGAKNGKVSSVDDLKGATWGVSRYGSGSHLMASVLASQKGWGVEGAKFKVVGAFDKLRTSVNDGSSDAFMWETFTTKPFHDSGEVKRVGEIFTPWPCFMLAAREDVATEKKDLIKRALAAVGEAAALFHKEANTMPQFIAKKYELKVEDAKQWYSGVKIAAKPEVSSKALATALGSLQKAGVLTKENYPNSKPLAAFVDMNIASLSNESCTVSTKRMRENDAGFQVSYWKIRGLGAPLRMMCAFAGANWSAVDFEAKMSADGTVDKKSWFQGAKPELIKRNPLLNLPFVIDNASGELVTQTLACMCFLAEKLGLMGSCAATTHQLLCEAHDLRNAAVKAFYGRQDYEPYITKTIPKEYAKFEAWLGLHKKPFLNGETPTAPDFHLWEMLDQNERFCVEIKAASSFLAGFPNLNKYYSSFRALPELKGYFNGPFYQYTCNNPHAKYPLPALQKEMDTES